MSGPIRDSARKIVKKTLPIGKLRGIKHAYQVGLFWPALQSCLTPGSSKERIGSEYGGWVIPTGVLTESSVCYCAGCGEDISFDLGLIERYGCTVVGLDPTPRSVAYVSRLVKAVTNYRFVPIGVWDKETTVKFFVPANPAHVSHSLANLHHTAEYFEAETARVGKIMRDRGHTALSLLKLDIEGAECDVIDSVLEEGLKIPVLAVEFDELNFGDRAGKTRVRETVKRLMASGYELFHVESANFTFILRRNEGIASAS